MNGSDAVQLRGQNSISESPGDQLPASVSWGAWAGIIGPALFTAAFLAQEAFRRGEYDPLAEPVSALEAGPNGWIQQINFVVFGLLTIAFAVGLHRGTAADPGRHRRTSIAIRQRYRLAAGRGLPAE